MRKLGFNDSIFKNLYKGKIFAYKCTLDPAEIEFCIGNWNFWNICLLLVIDGYQPVD